MISNGLTIASMAANHPSRSKFVIKNSRDGQFYFVFKAGNGETVVTSETYTTKASCHHGISCLNIGAAQAPTVDETPHGGLLEAVDPTSAFSKSLGGAGGLLGR